MTFHAFKILPLILELRKYTWFELVNSLNQGFILYVWNAGNKPIYNEGKALNLFHLAQGLR
jgi:hypothetical protein